MKSLPRWTVHYNIRSPIGSPGTQEWIGTGWEFFDELDDAVRRYESLRAANVNVTRRPFFEPIDRDHLGAAHGFVKWGAPER